MIRAVGQKSTKVFTQEHGPSTKVPRVYFILFQQDIFGFRVTFISRFDTFYIVFL